MIMHLLKNMAICTYAVFSGLSMATAVIFNTIWLEIKEFLNRKFVKIPENVFSFRNLILNLARIRPLWACAPIEVYSCIAHERLKINTIKTNINPGKTQSDTLKS